MVLVVARKRPPTAAETAAVRSTPIHGRGGGGAGEDVTDGPAQPGPQQHPGVRLSHTRHTLEHPETSRGGF